jgi:hypothetical protein
MEIRGDPGLSGTGRDDAIDAHIARQTDVAIRVCEGYFFTMVPSSHQIIVLCEKSCVLCGRSQLMDKRCFILQNLALPIEPRANQIRPTLRDGH